MDLDNILSINLGEALDFMDFLGALIFSLICSIICVWLYNATYGKNNIGTGVQRFFLLGGPSITALFLAIQFSLPLSLGLLGALSIVRFRTPVKDPEEIGYILLLIAASIGAATFNYWLVIILYAIVLTVLIVQRITRKYQYGYGLNSIIVRIKHPDAGEREMLLTKFIAGSLKSTKLNTMSTVGDEVSFHYQFARPKEFNWGVFNKGVEDLMQPYKCEIYMS